MRYIGIIILLVLCLTSLLFTGCKINTVKPETASGNLENNEDINQSSNNSQSSSTGLVYETVIADTGESVTVYPQKWATGDGTAENPWANDCIQKAYDFVPAGGTVYLKAGYYILSASVYVNKQINIIGEGRNKTIIITANAYGFEIGSDNGTVDYVTLKGFTIDGAAQTDGKAYLSPILIAHSNYILLEDIEAKNSGFYGICVYEVNHSSFQNIYVHDNWNNGMHPGSDEAGRNMYNTYRDIYAWDNGQCGFNDRGNGEAGLPIEECYNIYDNIQAWSNTLQGILIGYQKGATISGCYATDNEAYGFVFEGLMDSNISNCVATYNGFTASLSGVGISTSSTNLNLTNVIVLNNYSGFYIGNSSDIRLTSCQSYDDREPLLQRWGLQLTGTNTDISLLNCKLSPNSLGEIYNPAGAVVTVITEKMLAKF